MTATAASVERLIDFLGSAGEESTAEELAEMLWLAARLPAPRGEGLLASPTPPASPPPPIPPCGAASSWIPAASARFRRSSERYCASNGALA